MFKWNADKGKKLQEERGIDLNKIVSLIQSEQYFIVDVKNQDDHPNQKMYVVNLDGYPTCVPFVKESNGDIFFKTAFQNRRMKESNHG